MEEWDVIPWSKPPPRYGLALRKREGVASLPSVAVCAGAGVINLDASQGRLRAIPLELGQPPSLGAVPVACVEVEVGDDRTAADSLEIGSKDGRDGLIVAYANVDPMTIAALSADETDTSGTSAAGGGDGDGTTNTSGDGGGVGGGGETGPIIGSGVSTGASERGSGSGRGRGSRGSHKKSAKGGKHEGKAEKSIAASVSANVSSSSTTTTTINGISPSISMSASTRSFSTTVSATVLDGFATSDGDANGDADEGRGAAIRRCVRRCIPCNPLGVYRVAPYRLAVCGRDSTLHTIDLSTRGGGGSDGYGSSGGGGHDGDDGCGGGTSASISGWSTTARPQTSTVDRYRSPLLSMCVGTDSAGYVWSAVGLYDGTLRIEAKSVEDTLRIEAKSVEDTSRPSRNVMNGEVGADLARGADGGGSRRAGDDAVRRRKKSGAIVLRETLQLDGPLTSLSFTSRGTGGVGDAAGACGVDVTVGDGHGCVALCQFGFNRLGGRGEQQQHHHRQHSLRSVTQVAAFDDAVLSVARHDLTMDGTFDVIVGTADGRVVAFTEQDDSWQANDKYTTDEREGRSQSYVTDERWRCTWDRHLIFPVHDMKWADFDGDGIDELVVSTSNASHLFHYNVEIVKEKIEATAAIIEELTALRRELAS